MNRIPTAKPFFRAALAALLLSTPAGGAFAADGFSPAQKTEIQSVVREYLVKNPDVLIEALQAYRNQQEEATQKAFKDKISAYKADLTGETATYAGNPKGDVTIVEFFDYNCGYCKHAIDDVARLVKDDKNVRVVFKDYPILSESSGEAARYALAAAKQGKYWEFHQIMMKFSGERNETSYKSMARQAGLDFDRLKKDADSQEVRQEIEKNLELGRSLGVNGTPAFIFGDTMIPGYIGIDTMKQMTAQMRKDGKG